MKRRLWGWVLMMGLGAVILPAEMPVVAASSPAVQEAQVVLRPALTPEGEIKATISYTATHRHDVASCQGRDKIRAVELLVNNKPRRLTRIRPACQGQLAITLPLGELPTAEQARDLQLQARIYSHVWPAHFPWWWPRPKPVATSDVMTLSTSPASPITWQPRALEASLIAGTQTVIEASIETSTALNNVSLRFSPAIEALVTGDTGGRTAASPLSPLVMSLAIAVPGNTPIGSRTGEVTLLSDGKVIGSAPITINVTPASATVIPPAVGLPTADRVTSWHDNPVVQDELVVGLDLEITQPEDRIRQIAQQTGAVITGSVPALHMYQLRYAGVTLDQLETWRSRVQSLEGVGFAAHHPLAEASAALPDDPLFGSWDKSYRWGLEYIDAPAAWDITTGSSTTRIGMIDVGFDKRHEDLKFNINPTVGDTRLSGGLHGNNTAGVTCATGNNHLGITGVSWRCLLGLYDFKGSGSAHQATFEARQSAVAAASLMRQAAADGMQVVNMSLQWINNNNCEAIITPQTERDAQEYNRIFEWGIKWGQRMNSRGVLWVFAAGNECRDVKYSSPASLVQKYPLNTMAVAAINPSGERWEEIGTDASTGKPRRAGSDFGIDITVAAPGKNIPTTDKVECDSAGQCTSSYKLSMGTSLAAPFVTGLAGLVLSSHPNLTATQVRNCIYDAAYTYGKEVKGHSFNVINAPKAVACAAPNEAPCQFYGDGSHSCISTHNEVTLKRTNTGDTSACSFKVHVVWGDGAAEDFSFPGSAASGVFPYAIHHYDKTKPGRYPITITGEVTSGFCSISGVNYAFTLLPQR